MRSDRRRVSLGCAHCVQANPHTGDLRIHAVGRRFVRVAARTPSVVNPPKQVHLVVTCVLQQLSRRASESRASHIHGCTQCQVQRSGAANNKPKNDVNTMHADEEFKTA